MSNLTLVIVEGQDAGRELPIGGTVLVGRDPGADVVIADTEISSRHASFAPVDGGVAVEDLGSTNGTFVNGQRLTGTRQLQAGDRVQLGATVVEVRGLVTDPSAGASGCPSDSPAADPGEADPVAAGPRIRLRSACGHRVARRRAAGGRPRSGRRRHRARPGHRCLAPPRQLLARRLWLDGPGPRIDERDDRQRAPPGLRRVAEHGGPGRDRKHGDRHPGAGPGGRRDARRRGDARRRHPGSPPERHRRRGARQGLRLVSRGRRRSTST